MSAEGAAQHHFASAGPLGLINYTTPTPSLRSGLFSAGASRLDFGFFLRTYATRSLVASFAVPEGPAYI
jgi:hypothetical protein